MKKKLLSLIIISAIFIQILLPVSASETVNADFEFLPLVNTGMDYSPDGYEIPQYPVSGSNRPLRAARVIPDSFDLRDSGAVTSVKDQGKSGNCWAFATCASLESNAIMQGLATADEVDFSEAHLVWFTKNPISSDPEDNLASDGENNTSPYTSGSNAASTAVTLARGSGIANESDYPFYPYDISFMGNYPESARYDSASGYVFDSFYQYSTVSEIKTAIMTTSSVMTVYYHDESYFNKTNAAYYYPTDRSTESVKVNHAVTVVGWDDSYAKENFSSENQPAADGAWLCKNSWSSGWGDNGYFWISYEDKTFSTCYGFTLTGNDSYDRCYTYNSLAPGGYMSFTGSVSLGNKYTAKRNENINSVSFWIVQTGLTAEINIYTDISESGSPFDGSPAYTYSFTTDKIGLLRFELDESIPLDKGESFMASIKLTAPSSSEKILYPFEVSGGNYSGNADESYILFSKKLYDAHLETGLGIENAYINVQTSCRHSLTEQSVTASTCVENGECVFVCDQCGKTFAESLPLAEHKFGEWKTVLIPTAVSEGIDERVCSVCGLKETEAEPMLSSNGKNVVFIDDLIEMMFERFVVIIRMFFRLNG